MIGVGPKPIPDTEFFYTLHTLSVDGVLFRVPTHLLSDSYFFRELLNLDAPHRSAQPESRSSQPRPLQGVTAAEFRDFYRVLEAAPYRVNGMLGATPTSWETVLKLADRWKFTALRDIALTHIEHHEGCVLRFHIARRYRIPQLLPEALRELAERDEPLQHSEHELLGSELAAGVMHYREARWRSDVDPDTQDWRRTHVMSVFGAEFARDWEAGMAQENT